MVQQVRKSITTLIFFVSGALWAQAPSTPLAIKPEAPDRYIVVPGDTLWSIAERYTDSPWRWPDLWNFNRDQIRNPHLIYPGYVLVLDRAKGTLSIASPGATPPTAVPAPSTPGEAAQTTTPPPPTTSTTAAEPGLVKLSPRLRAESLAKQGVPSIPASIIEPFLSRPLVIEPDGLDKGPTIVGTQGDRVILEPGNRAYARGLRGSKEEIWYVFRRGGPLVDPETGITLAFEAIYLGTAQLTRSGEPATVLLTSAVQEVGAGDKLVAAGRPQSMNYAPHAPSKEIRGRVMTIYGGSGRASEAGPQSVITLSRGRADGLEIGHVLAIYSYGGIVHDASKPRGTPDSNIQLPDERAGIAFVFRVFDRVSYAMVMQATRPIRPLDVVRTP